MMQSNQPQKPVKTNVRRSKKPLAFALAFFVAVPLFVFSWIGCDSAAIDAPAVVVDVAVPATVAVLDPAEVAIATIQEPPVAPVQEALFPLDADTKAELGAASKTEILAADTTGFQAKQEIESPPEVTAEPSMLEKAGSLLNQAKSKGAAAASGTGKWVQGKLGTAAETGEQTVDDTMKWATDTFNSLKERGLTTANDTSEWLSEDWSNMDCWQYQVVTFGDFSDEQLAKKMNELGKAGWECFHVDHGKYMFKKPSNSYLRSLPFKDVIKLVPLMGAAAAGKN